jgi:two-component system, chemotaxis family, chemotaxis protein CheY
MKTRRVVLAGLSEPSTERASSALGAAGYEVIPLASPDPLLAMARDGRQPELVVLDETFGEDGGVALCRALRADPAWRAVSLMVVVPAGEQRLEECLVAGINDFILEPFPDDELLEKAARLTEVPARRDLNTIARLRDLRSHEGSLMGKTLNISLNGLLVEIEAYLPVGRLVEIEFFLPEDPQPLRVTGRVIRRAQELDLYHPAFGIRFEEMSDADRSRIDAFVARRERDAAPGGESS